MTTTAIEGFLRSFHARHAGVTSQLLADGKAEDGRSSYELLRDAVTGADRVLDLGCGDGVLLGLLADRRLAVGFDLSEGELAKAAQRLAAPLLVQGTAREMPFPDRAFDACVSHMAFMLMPEIDRVAAELARVLVPGGRLALVMGWSGGDDPTFELFLSVAVPIIEAGERIPALGDRRTRNPDGLTEILVSAGFSAPRMETLWIDLSHPLDEVLDRLCGMYDVRILDEPTLAELRARFTELATPRLDANSLLRCRMPLTLATATVDPTATVEH
jgi:ubiquinone/menaquinone biosynthesis C-methylase UbiE